MKLPAHIRAELPGKVILFCIVPLDPAFLPSGRQGGSCGSRSGQGFQDPLEVAEAAAGDGLGIGIEFKHFY